MMALDYHIITQSDSWRVLFVPLADPVDHSMDDISGWPLLPGPYANGDNNPAPFNTYWRSGMGYPLQDMWLCLDLDPKWRDLVVAITLEDHGLVYLNGVLVAGQSDSGSGTSAGYSIWDIPNTHMNLGQTNRLAIRCNDERDAIQNQTSVWAYIDVWASTGSGWKVGAVSCG